MLFRTLILNTLILSLSISPSAIVEVKELQAREDYNTSRACFYEAAKTWVNQEELAILTNCLYGEARGLSKTEQSAVIWCIFNRVDAGYGDIISVVTTPKQFTGYNPKRVLKTKQAQELYNKCEELVLDVYARWIMEKCGYGKVGRTLPNNYLYFLGYKGHNWFRNNFKDKTNVWDWNLPSPYVD